MAPRVVSRRELPIASEDDIALVRGAVRELAEQHGLDPFATAAVTTASSELTRNTLVHGGGGRAVVEEIEDGDAVGICAMFRDEGPGIRDLERVLRGGYSSTRSLGLGLSGSRRRVDDLHVDTAVGRGTWLRSRSGSDIDESRRGGTRPDRDRR